MSLLRDIQSDFPMYQTQKNLVYLDSAASTLTPRVVIDAMDTYYKEYRSNIHRGLYPVAAIATERYEEARKTIAEFVQAKPKEIIFTSGSTAGLNFLAQSLSVTLSKGDNIVLTELEHHANLVPWQQAAKKHGFEIRFLEVTPSGKIKEEDIEKKIDKNTKIVSTTVISNALGTIVPVQTIIDQAKKVHAITILDAAQAIAHMPMNTKDLDCDFLVVSGHKMYGPTGIGFVYGKLERLEQMEPSNFGGEMIQQVTFQDATWAAVPQKFEAGTPNIAGAIGLATAAVYLLALRWNEIQKHEEDLKRYLLDQLREHATIVGPELAQERGGVVSFAIPGLHPHDIAEIAGRTNVCIRAGHHCTMPLMKKLALSGTARASIGLYNTRHDIDALINAIQEAKKVFGV